MKVMIVSTLFPPFQVGGAELSVAELALDLVREGHEVSVVTLAPKSQPPRDELPGVRVYRRRTRAVEPFFDKRPRRSLAAKILWQLAENIRLANWVHLRTAIKQESPDVIHTNTTAGFGPAAWLSFHRIPRVHTIRDFYLSCMSFRGYKDGRNCENRCASCTLGRLAVGPASERAVAVTAISADAAVRSQQLGRFREKQIRVIHNAPTHVRVPRREPGEHCVIGYIGRAAEYKGVWVLLDALLAVPEPSVRLVIAGGASEEDVRKLRAWPDSRVDYRGRMDRQAFFGEVDVVAVPSQWHEPFGRVAAEAASAGCAVVVSGVGGLVEASGAAPLRIVVEHPSSVEEWAHALQSATAFRSKGSPESTERSTPAGPTGQYMEAFREVAAHARGDSPLERQQ